MRDRLKERGEAIARARETLEAGLSQRDGVRIGAALADADPAGAGRGAVALDWSAHGETLTLWAGRLWEADDPYPILASFWEADPLPGAGLWLPAAVLHLRDPQRFAPWGEAARRGYATLDDALDAAGSAAERYRLFNEGVTWLRSRHHVHPLETADVLAALAPEAARRDEPAATFGGFCADTFRFLAELADDNRREWMDGQRDRYRFAVREPLAELCRALAARYVEPVLRGVHGWDIDAEARSGRALTSICKNDYGRSRPYNTAMWIAFCRRGGRRRRPTLRPPGRDGTALRLSRRPQGRGSLSALPNQRREVWRSALSGAAGRRRTGVLPVRPAGRRRRPRRDRRTRKPAEVVRRAVVRDRVRPCRRTPRCWAATSWPAKSC